MSKSAALSAINFPNVLSLIRLGLALGLPVVAGMDRADLFFGMLFVALFTDAIDGWIARRLSQTSQLGIRMDSWSDLVLCFTVLLGVWLLFPELVRHEGIYVLILLVSYIIPTVVALVKYRRIPSYHTRIAKIAGVLTAVTGLILLLRGPSLPFRLVVLLVVIEAIEESAITVVLPQLTGNVPSLAEAYKIRSRDSAE